MNRRFSEEREKKEEWRYQRRIQRRLWIGRVRDLRDLGKEMKERTWGGEVMREGVIYIDWSE